MWPCFMLFLTRILRLEGEMKQLVLVNTIKMKRSIFDFMLKHIRNGFDNNFILGDVKDLQQLF